MHYELTNDHLSMWFARITKFLSQQLILWSINPFQISSYHFYVVAPPNPPSPPHFFPKKEIMKKKRELESFNCL